MSTEEEGFESKIKLALANMENFKNLSKGFRAAVLNGNKQIQLFNHIVQRKVIAHSQLVIIGLLRDKLCHPISKLLAVKFTKDLIETFNDEFISQAQYSILPILEKIAQFKQNDPDEDRGKSFFQFEQGQEISPELQSIGNSFLRLTLECIWVWGKWFPIDPETFKISGYRICFQRLIRLEVKFPQLKYFGIDEVNSHLPETLTPVEMLSELKDVLNNDSKKQNPGSIRQLAETVQKQMNNGAVKGNLSSNKTHAHLFQKLFDSLKQHKQNLGQRKFEANRRATVQNIELPSPPDSKKNKNYVINVQNSESSPQQKTKGPPGGDIQGKNPVNPEPVQLNILQQNPIVESRYVPDPQEYQMQLNNQQKQLLEQHQQKQQKLQQQSLLLSKKENEIHGQVLQHISEKDELHTEIQQHVYDKERLNNEMTRHIKEKHDLWKQVETQKAELEKMKTDLQLLKQNKDELQDKHDQIVNMQQGVKQPLNEDQDSKDLQRQIQKKDIQLQRAQSELDRHKQIVFAHEQTIDAHTSHKQELEDQVYRHIGDKEELKSQVQTHMQTVARQQVQVQKAQTQIKELQEKHKNLKKEHTDLLQKHSQQIQEIQAHNIELLDEKGKQQDELNQLSLTHTIVSQDLEAHKTYVKQLSDLNQRHVSEKEELIKTNQNLLAELNNLRNTQTNGFNSTIKTQPLGSQIRGPKMESAQQPRSVPSQIGYFSSSKPKLSDVKAKPGNQQQNNFQIIDQNPHVFQVDPALISDKFRMSALKDKSTIYSDGRLQIGCITKINTSAQGSDSVELYLTNNKQQKINNLQFSFQASSGMTISMKPLNQPLQIDKQLQIVLYITLVHIPFGIPTISIQYEQQIKLIFNKSGMHQPEEILLPLTINKFFKYQQLDQKLFPQMFTLISQPFQLNSDISKALPQFTSIPPQDPSQQEIICAQVLIKGSEPFMTIRISRDDSLATIEVESGHQQQAGTFVLQSLIELLQ